MKKLLCLVLVLLLLGGCAPSPERPGAFLVVTDDTGSQVWVPERPRRVAVLLSSLADLWISAGGTVDITVGEAVERGFAPETAVLVDSGAGKTIHTEALMAAQPDLVLYSSDLAGQRDCAQLLKTAGIPAIGFGIECFEDYLRVLKIATDILDTPERYEAYGVKVQQEIEDLICLAQGQENAPSFLFIRAGSTAKVTKAKTKENHFVCAMLDVLGGENIADKAPILLDGLSVEEILLADPEHIFYTTMGDESAAHAYMDSLTADPVWSRLTAVQAGRVYGLPKELFQYKPNARWAEAYAYLIRLLYGDIL